MLGGTFMDFLKNRTARTASVYILAVMVVVIIILALNTGDSAWPLQRRIIAVVLVILGFFPIAFMAHKWRDKLEHSRGYSLKEFSLSEEELTQAVRLWVYASKGKPSEGEVRFMMNDEGQILAQYYMAEE